MIKIQKEETALEIFLQDDSGFSALIQKLHKDRGFDFGDYRPKCLRRRIWTRVNACGFQTYLEYMAYLNRRPEEYDKLLDVLTINVTEFFRNSEAFQYLKAHILPRIIQDKEASGRKIIRCWSAGCSSGEEPYTLAILFYELLGKNIDQFIIKIYGTDIDKICLEKAKRGEYALSSVKEVTEPELHKYFSLTPQGYAVSDRLRLITKFRTHNLVQDPPLKHMDLIICRNVFIYFGRDLQDMILKKFHESLNQEGYMMLGKIESLMGDPVHLFKPMSNAERIYQKK